MWTGTSHPLLLIMPTALGPFELRQIIGKGGMGEVWGGVHVSEGEPVAVKVLTRAGARREEYLEAFHNEVRAVDASISLGFKVA